MASIQRSISTRAALNGEAEIMLRLCLSPTERPRIKSGITVNPGYFKNGKFVKPRNNPKLSTEINEKERKLLALEKYLYEVCQEIDPNKLTKELLEYKVQQFHHPEKSSKEEVKTAEEEVVEKPKPRKRAVTKAKDVDKANESDETDKDFYECYNVFLGKRVMSDRRRDRYKCLERTIHRYELYRKAKGKTPYKIGFEMFTTEVLEGLENFMRIAHTLWPKYKSIFVIYPTDTRKTHKLSKPKPKGDNAIICDLNCLRAFFRWVNAEGIHSGNPFTRYQGKTTERYGTPYYITIEERDQIADFDLSNRPELAVQRDIFIFQCCIGCRISDLYSLTPNSIINGAVEYIAKKTKGERPTVIRVPLTQRALDIIERYKDVEKKKNALLPFIAMQNYNYAIKSIFKICGVTRIVTIINPHTGDEEQRPINELASSHLARRTFVGNLYKKVKDPNLVGALSGHAEGSKAFARYRQIDDDMKKELIGFIE